MLNESQNMTEYHNQIKLIVTYTIIHSTAYFVKLQMPISRRHLTNRLQKEKQNNERMKQYNQ